MLSASRLLGLAWHATCRSSWILLNWVSSSIPWAIEEPSWPWVEWRRSDYIWSTIAQWLPDLEDIYACSLASNGSQGCAGSAWAYRCCFPSRCTQTAYFEPMFDCSWTKDHLMFPSLLDLVWADWLQIQSSCWRNRANCLWEYTLSCYEIAATQTSPKCRLIHSNRRSWVPSNVWANSIFYTSCEACICWPLWTGLSR